MATQEYAQDPNEHGFGMEEDEEGLIMAPMLVAKLQVRLLSLLFNTRTASHRSNIN